MLSLSSSKLSHLPSLSTFSPLSTLSTLYKPSTGQFLNRYSHFSSNSWDSQISKSSKSGLDEETEVLGNKFIAPTYTKDGVRSKKGMVLSHGSGTEVWDTHGNRYLDFSSGIAVSMLGHGNKEIAENVCDQLKKISHSSNIFNTNPPAIVAKKLIGLSPGFSKVFFTNSGTESNEGALKFAKIYSNMCHENVEKRKKIIAFENSFHGRSLGALSLTYKPKIREPFDSLLNKNVVFLPFNDTARLEKEIDETALAVFLEPVQGEGGINPAEVSFIHKAREMCDKYGSLLVFDEVQIGLGRSGNNQIWGYEYYKTLPDILTCAKPLAAGLPMGAILLSQQYMDRVNAAAKAKNVSDNSFFLGLHGSTFAGNPVVARAAEVVLTKLEDKKFLGEIAANGEYFIGKLLTLAERHKNVVRKVNRPLGDKSLFAGLLLKGSCGFGVDKVVAKAVDEGLLILSAGDKNEIIRICPPLNVKRSEIEEAMIKLDKAITAAVSEEAQSRNLLRFGPSKDEYSSKEDYDGIIRENAVLPKGFQIGGTTFEFLPFELGAENKKKYRMSMSIVKLDSASHNYAAVFTKNKFPGAPVKIGKEILAMNKSISAIVVNNRISNVHPKEGGVADAQKLCQAIIKEFNLDDKSAVVPSSTGIIGWRLPVTEMIQNVKACGQNFSNANGYEFAHKIMTTDNYPKAKTVCITDDKGEVVGRLTGFAKGAGMIEPNMATMLVFIFTDINTEGFSNNLQFHLTSAVNKPGSFNKISIDSDQSTSDTVILLSSNVNPLPKDKSVVANIEQAFSKGLESICKELSEEIVRNGEGVEHVIKVAVRNAPTQQIADGAGKRIVNSPLVKTAIAGNDPNVGRIIAAIGNYLSDSNVDQSRLHSKMRIKVGEYLVFAKGEFQLDGEKELKLIEYMKKAKHSLEGKYPQHKRCVEIEVEFCDGKYDTEVIGSDLTDGYVKENAGYRS